MLAGLVLLSLAIPSVTLAQQTDTVRVQPTTVSPSTTTSGRNYERENIYRLGKGVYTDTLRRSDFKAQASDVAELDDCDTTFQTFILVRRLSPWRVGLFAGPNFAYCGTWENTFGPNKRDNTLYNGAGFNITGNIDYFLTPATRRLRFGLGTAFGYQNYITRNAYREYLYGLAATLPQPATRDQVTIRQRASEDMFLTVGPVLTFTLTRSRRNPDATTFIEAAARGGLFRTEAATITAFVPSQGTLAPGTVPSLVEGGRLIRSVNPSSNLYHLGALGSLAVFFPLRNNWNIGVQGQGFITRLNYLIVNGVDNQMYEFKRKHGGFSAGVAVRKGFIQKKLIPKAPVVCPTCDSIPQLRVQFNGASLKGASLAYVDSTDEQRFAAINKTASAPVISWRSTTLNPRNETFTARLYYHRIDTVVANPDSLIAELVNTTDTTLTFPASYYTGGQLRPGSYNVTVHSRQAAKCGTCISEVATTTFASIPPNENKECLFRHRLERLEVFYRTPYTKNYTSVCYCEGTASAPVKKFGLFRRSRQEVLPIEVIEFDTNTVILDTKNMAKDLPNYLATQLQAKKSSIENNNSIRYKGRRVRPQVSYFRAVFTVTKLPCNGQPEQAVGSFNTTISDNTYSITDLKPLTDAQKTKLLAPPAPVKKRATRRRGGNSGRRDSALFGVE